MWGGPPRSCGEREFVPAAPPPPREAPASVGVVVIGLYVRIVTMHMVIIVGAALSVVFGSLAPFLLLIGIKTLIDVGTHIAIDLGAVRDAGQPSGER